MSAIIIPIHAAKQVADACEAIISIHAKEQDQERLRQSLREIERLRRAPLLKKINDAEDMECLRPCDTGTPS